MEKVSWRHPDPRASGATTCQFGVCEADGSVSAFNCEAAASMVGSDPGAYQLLQRLSLRAEVLRVEELGHSRRVTGSFEEAGRVREGGALVEHQGDVAL